MTRANSAGIHPGRLRIGSATAHRPGVLKVLEEQRVPEESRTRRNRSASVLPDSSRKRSSSTVTSTMRSTRKLRKSLRSSHHAARVHTASQKNTPSGRTRRWLRTLSRLS